jgi:enoyl-CoA hydratase/carnithine racemase
MADEISDLVLVEDEGAVRVLTLNRPEKMNALNTALTTALFDALVAAEQEDSVRAVVLAGAGRAFCAGADLSEFKDLRPENQHLVIARADLTTRVQSQLQELSKPIVSAVQGPAIGGGAGLAIGCDMAVAGGDLKFGYPEIRHGIVPAIVMTGLQRHLGRKAAFEMISLGRLIGADEALNLGLFNRVVEPEAVRSTATEIALTWASFNGRAMRAVKSLYYRVVDLPFDEAMTAGRDVNAQMRAFNEE